MLLLIGTVNLRLRSIICTTVSSAPISRLKLLEEFRGTATVEGWVSGIASMFRRSHWSPSSQSPHRNRIGICYADWVDSVGREPPPPTADDVPS